MAYGPIQHIQLALIGACIGAGSLLNPPPGLAQASVSPIQPSTVSATEETDLSNARERFEAGDTIGAIERWSRLLLKQPKHQAALFNRAQAYLLLEQHALALADLDALGTARQGQQLADAIVLRGVALAALGQQNRAMQSFNQAWTQGKSLLALANKAILLKTMGKQAEAHELTKQLVLLEPSIANYYNLATLQKDLQKYAACRETSSIILRNNASHAPSYALRGICAYQQRQDDRALEDLLRSHSLTPAQAEPLTYIGKILLRRGKRDEGISWILKAASLYLQQGKAPEHQQALDAARQQEKT